MFGFLKWFKRRPDFVVGDSVGVVYDNGTQSKYIGTIKESMPNFILVETQVGYRRFYRDKILSIERN